MNYKKAVDKIYRKCNLICNATIEEFNRCLNGETGPCQIYRDTKYADYKDTKVQLRQRFKCPLCKEVLDFKEDNGIFWCTQCTSGFNLEALNEYNIKQGKIAC